MENEKRRRLGGKAYVTLPPKHSKFSKGATATQNIHNACRANSLEKTLVLGKTEGKRRRERQRMRCLDSITNSVDMNLSQLREIGQGSLASWSPRGCRVRHDLATEQQKQMMWIGFYGKCWRDCVLYLECHGLLQVQSKRTLVYGVREKRKNVSQENLRKLRSRLLSVGWGLGSGLTSSLGGEESSAGI